MITNRSLASQGFEVRKKSLYALPPYKLHKVNFLIIKFSVLTRVTFRYLVKSLMIFVGF